MERRYGFKRHVERFVDPLQDSITLNAAGFQLLSVPTFDRDAFRVVVVVFHHTHQPCLGVDKDRWKDGILKPSSVEVR